MKNLWPILTAIAALSAQASNAMTAGQLRDAITADARAKGGAEQHIRFGPMKDGRVLNVTTVIISNSSDIRIVPAGDNMYVIQMGRVHLVQSVYLADAMIICGHFRQIVCPRMAKYAELVSSSQDPAQAPLIEEAFPDLKVEAQEVRGDDALYRASLGSGINSLMLLITLHEIGHAALHHLDHPTSSTAVEIEQEGQADGFAAHVALMGDQLPGGLAMPFMLDSIDELIKGSRPTAHPLALCRFMAASTKSLEWLNQHEAEFLTPADNATHDKFDQEVARSLSSPELGITLNPSNLPSCKEYLSSFGAGYARASLLVDQKTNIDSAVPGQP